MSRPQVAYGVIPRSFSAEGLAGVEKRLPYLVELGVDMIWLSPIFEHPPHEFGYGTTDYRRVDPEHGSVHDLQRLVETAHRNNLRIILDLAPNHTSDRHPFYADVQERGAASAYAGHYVKGDDGAYAHYFNWTNLINLDYGHADVQQMMLEAMEYWINECDVDGYRFDAAWGIRERTPDFWPRCIDRLRQSKPDLFLLAEASALDPYYLEAGFDAAYDWTTELGTWAWTSAFTGQRGPAPVLRELLSTTPHPTRVFRFLNNNDTGARFLSVHGEQRYKLAAAMLLTLPGIACIYMGDEVGLEFKPYDDKGPVRWPENRDLHDFHRRLIALRKGRLAGSCQLTHLGNDQSEQCLSYILHGSGPPLVCTFNFGPAVQVHVELPVRSSGIAKDLWNQEAIAFDSARVALSLDGNAFSLLELGSTAGSGLGPVSP
jgi:glycosidase